MDSCLIFPTLVLTTRSMVILEISQFFLKKHIPRLTGMGFLKPMIIVDACPQNKVEQGFDNRFVKT